MSTMMILVPLSDENIKRSSGIEALRCSEAWMKLNLRNLLIRTWLKILKHCTSNIHSVTDREPRRLLLANSFDWARKSTASFFKAFDRLFVYQAYQEPAENFNRSADEFVHLKIQKRQNFQKNLFNIRKVTLDTIWNYTNITRQIIEATNKSTQSHQCIILKPRLVRPNK